MGPQVGGCWRLELMPGQGGSGDRRWALLHLCSHALGPPHSVTPGEDVAGRKGTRLQRQVRLSYDGHAFTGTEDSPASAGVSAADTGQPEARARSAGAGPAGHSTQSRSHPSSSLWAAVGAPGPCHGCGKPPPAQHGLPHCQASGEHCVSDPGPGSLPRVSLTAASCPSLVVLCLSVAALAKASGGQGLPTTSQGRFPNLALGRPCDHEPPSLGPGGSQEGVKSRDEFQPQVPDPQVRPPVTLNIAVTLRQHERLFNDV